MRNGQYAEAVSEIRKVLILGFIETYFLVVFAAFCLVAVPSWSLWVLAGIVSSILTAIRFTAGIMPVPAILWTEEDRKAIK